jgi:hypothetical protein
MLVGQALYHLSHDPVLFFFCFVNGAWGWLKDWILLPLGWDYTMTSLFVEMGVSLTFGWTSMAIFQSLPHKKTVCQSIFTSLSLPSSNSYFVLPGTYKLLSYLFLPGSVI